ncbi:hypothetical protein [Wolbachia endosymbiont of Tribolium confusum]|uniref:hypothetical protein n=1 Tax=Wolbachia endosymbiont of Tribolium confusum TaxID=214474 RepID=UPI001CF1A962|nr:hypothetical protein [Wolbachia endosymbiont of Tribolium confusum]MCA7010198.1 hypothetical protein [Wolbachia endosymbiont of Tribolium confusum]
MTLIFQCVTHNCTNITIWSIVNGVIPALDAGIQKFFEHKSYAKFLLVRKSRSQCQALE